jgi:histidine triad (HIT) family protein
MLDLKRHVPQIGEMTEREAGAVGVAMKRTAQALQEVLEAEHVYTLVSGNAVPHVHMHIVPRYPGTPAEFWGPMDVYDWPDAPLGNKKDIQLVSRKFKQYMSRYHHA